MSPIARGLCGSGIGTLQSGPSGSAGSAWRFFEVSLKADATAYAEIGLFYKAGARTGTAGINDGDTNARPASAARIAGIRSVPSRRFST